VDIYLNSNHLAVTQNKYEPNIQPFEIDTQLMPGDNYIMASVQNNLGGPAGFCMTCLGGNGNSNSVLFHTDASWKYTPIHPGKMIPESETYSVDTCQQLAKEFGYSYYGLQGQGQDKSLCYLSNNLKDATQYGSAIQSFQESDQQYYGGTGVSAVYEIDPVPDIKTVGKVGYLDGMGGSISEYPASMLSIQKNNTYQKMAFADNPSGGNAIPFITVSSKTPKKDILGTAALFNVFKNFQPESIPNVTQQQCEAQCNSNNKCQAYVYNPSSKDCKLKSSNAFPKTPVTYSSSTDVYYTPYTVNANSSCSPQVRNIDAVQWSKYRNTGQVRTEEDLCGLSKATNQQQMVVEQLKNSLVDITEKLIQKTDSLGSLNIDILNKIGIDKQTFYDDMEEYKKLLHKLKHQSKSDNTHTEIVRETEMSATRANYSLMLWSVLVVVALMILIYLWKK
jgi:hypothetical protein